MTPRSVVAKQTADQDALHRSNARLNSEEARPARRAVEKAFDELIATAEIDAIEQAVANRNVESGAKAFDFDAFEVALAIALTAAALRALSRSSRRERRRLQRLVSDVAAEVSSRANTERVATLAATRAARLARETRNGLRVALTAALVAGRDPQEIVERILLSVGLTQRQSATLERLQQRLEQDDLTPDQVKRHLRITTLEMRRRRARLIATDAMTTAISEGQFEPWQAAVDAGDLREQEIRQRWITAGDNKVDPICKALEGQVVVFRGTFTVNLRTKRRGLLRTHSALAPGIHPGCRCTLQFFVIAA